MLCNACAPYVCVCASACEHRSCGALYSYVLQAMHTSAVPCICAHLSVYVWVWVCLLTGDGSGGQLPAASSRLTAPGAWQHLPRGLRDQDREQHTHNTSVPLKQYMMLLVHSTSKDRWQHTHNTSISLEQYMMLLVDSTSKDRWQHTHNTSISLEQYMQDGDRSVV